MTRTRTHTHVFLHTYIQLRAKMYKDRIFAKSIPVYSFLTTNGTLPLLLPRLDTPAPVSVNLSLVLLSGLLVYYFRTSSSRVLSSFSTSCISAPDVVREVVVITPIYR